jgi:hypothetical protein
MSTQRYPESVPSTATLWKRALPRLDFRVRIEPDGLVPSSERPHCGEDRTLRAVLVGMLREAER